MNRLIIDNFTKKLISWLTCSKIVNENGGVYSWINCNKPGYVYHEIIGYYIKLLSYLYYKTSDKIYLDKASKSVNYLYDNLGENNSMGRGEYQYVFDTAICVSGIINFSNYNRLNNNQEIVLYRLVNFIYSSLKKKEVAYKNNRSIIKSNRWSFSYGPFLIKNAIALYEASDYFDEEKYRELSDSMITDIVKKTFREVYFSINQNHHYVYTHNHCYAVEGLLLLQSKGDKRFIEHVRKSADWLADNQNNDGSMYNWYLNEEVSLDKQGDATSQAVRIWQCFDKVGYSSNIKKGINFLKSLFYNGGMRYNITESGEKSDDINAWVTIFSVQAFLWDKNKPDLDWII